MESCTECDFIGICSKALKDGVRYVVLCERAAGACSTYLLSNTVLHFRAFVNRRVVLMGTETRGGREGAKIS